MKEKTREVIEVINKEKDSNKTIEFFKGIGTIILYFIFALIGGIIFGNYYESSNKLIAGLSQLGTYLIMLDRKSVV